MQALHVFSLLVINRGKGVAVQCCAKDMEREQLSAALSRSGRVPMNAGVDVRQELIHFRFSGCISSELEECFLRVHHRNEWLEHGDLALVLQGVQCREIVQRRLQHTK